MHQTKKWLIVINFWDIASYKNFPCRVKFQNTEQIYIL